MSGVRQGIGRRTRHGLIYLFVILFVLLPLAAAQAAPYAAMVMDARTGEVVHSRNADTRLHPASLTKMMTLYIAFQAVERGEISLDTKVKISSKAAAEPPSKLGLKAGQRIALRYLIRAAAIKSANDASTAIGEALEGSEAAFARRMNRTAKALGMSRTTFKNAHGLTESGHLSTARDMTTLGRHLLYDYPDYYNLFARRSTDVGGKTVNNTNRRLLAAYRGADGIKTGYTRAAGFNLVASAERGNKRVIATMFGGTSGAARNARVAELLDMGFDRTPSAVATIKPPTPNYAAAASTKVTVAQSPRPRQNPRYGTVAVARAEPIVTPGAVALALTEATTPVLPAETDAAVQIAMTAEPENDAEEIASTDAELARTLATALDQAAQASAMTADKAGASLRPRARPITNDAAIAAEAEVEVAELVEEEDTPDVVTRLSTAGGRHWSINVGRYGSRYEAERVLLQTALGEIETLDEARRKVIRKPTGFEANFVGLSEGQAQLACARLSARNRDCTPIGPS